MQIKNTKGKMSAKMKPRSDSKLHGLAAEQRAKLEGWLFGENRRLEEVAERCEKEFGVTVNETTVGRYRQREKARWETERLAGTGNGDTRPAPGTSAEEKYRELLIRLAEFVLTKADDLEDEENRKMVAEFTKVLIAARRESNYAQRAALAREKFEFDAATACLLNQVEVQSVMKDEAMDDGERILKLRQELFGKDLPE
jgi:hypothetical protein